MKAYYNITLSHVSTSPLNYWDQARLDDIYMPPNLQLMINKKGSFKKTDRQITDYENVFLNRSKLNKHMFIQGEAGSGKPTFLAKLVMDWCCINTTKSFDTSQTETTHNTVADLRVRRTHFFEDLTILNDYIFVFNITLSDSVEQIYILEMIKQQIIDSLYVKDVREDAYTLLNVIMERERCLVLLDGLDEWTGQGGHYLPTLAASYRQCDVLITTRPWKLTELKISDSKIDILLQLEGVNEPFDVSKRLLACVDESKTSNDVENKQSEFESYIYNNGLYEQLVSPMMLSLIVQLWVKHIEIKSSKCELYSLLQDSLLKKANGETGEFQQPPFRCFKWTQYIEPNIEHVDRLAEGAFNLLFSDKRNNSLMFSSVELKKYNLDKKERLDFSLKSGILSATRKVSTLRSSSSFYQHEHARISRCLSHRPQ
ncbi:hypothetical protein DPMN_158797 [Dreissena polymorpha]|uniref:NACHT domain-containing protein n=1 Tax=Dreissena polymorpha TaxID=45954 RepID=A0A9D4EIH0_DREPO|nr:hypothetical protein DPMN_158797 [Dreissena polymorpha]